MLYSPFIHYRDKCANLPGRSVSTLISTAFLRPEGSAHIHVEIQHKEADQGAIEDVLAVEDDVVPFDQADVLGAGLRPGLPW